jgi:23S rRNA (guanine745-N1)-methyltransferase
MKEVLYENPYENPVKREDYPCFAWQKVVPLRYTVTLNDSADIMALFSMTPYAWKTPKAGVERLSQLPQLETEIGFDIHIYKKV